MKMNVGHTFQVWFHAGTPEGEPLMKPLTEILSLVKEIVDYFDRVLE